jgi:uncharacterized protein YcbX
MHLSGLFIYPVKSLRGIAVESAQIDELGLVGDRRFMVVDETDRCITQRSSPRMAIIETELTPTELILRAPNVGTCTIPRCSSSPPVPRTVSIWKSEGLIAEDTGEDSSRWLSSFLGLRCRLVRIGKEFRRPVINPKSTQPGDVFTFADGYPFLLTTEASLADLNDRILARGGEAVPMNRFRPNLVVSNAESFAEDNWPLIEIGSATFRDGGPCERCVITTTDQLTSERGKEPLRTLAHFRRSPTDPTAILFGRNFIHQTKTGSLHIGDRLSLLR